MVLLGTGCATTQETRQALTGYVQAMEQVELSANMFLSDFSDGLKVQAQLAQVGGVGQAPAHPEYPTEFVLPSDPKKPQTETDKALLKSRQALVAVRQYNDALVALAEGHSEQDIRQKTTQLGAALETLGTLVGAAVPGLGALTAIGPKIIKLAQDAANRQQLEQAVNEGREPVHLILQDLEAQTPEMYRLSVVGTRQAQTKLKEDINRVARALRALIARYGPPTDQALAGKMAALQAQLGDIGAKTGMRAVMPIPLPYANDQPPYEATAAAESDIFMQSLGATTQKYLEVIAKQNAYHDLMTKYVLTLRQTGSSLDLVAESLARPVDLRAEVGQLLKVAFDLRDAMSAYRNPPVAPLVP